MAPALAGAEAMAAAPDRLGETGNLLPATLATPVDPYVQQPLDEGYVGRVRQVFWSAFIGDFADSSQPLPRRQDHRVYGAINPLSLGSSWDMIRYWLGDAERLMAWEGHFTPERSDGPGGPPLKMEMPD